MSAEQEIRNDRLKKRALLAAAGMNPYTATTERSHSLAAVLRDFETLLEEEEQVIVAGRVLSLRRHGGVMFIDLDDGSGRMQMFVEKDTVGLKLFSLLSDTIDGGDFIEITGVPFVTKRGGEAVNVSSWKVLTKALSNPPTEHFGIKDEDERYRKRYLDLMLDKKSATCLCSRISFGR